MDRDKLIEYTLILMILTKVSNTVGHACNDIDVVFFGSADHAILLILVILLYIVHACSLPSTPRR